MGAIHDIDGPARVWTHHWGTVHVVGHGSSITSSGRRPITGGVDVVIIQVAISHTRLVGRRVGRRVVILFLLLLFFIASVGLVVGLAKHKGLGVGLSKHKGLGIVGGGQMDIAKGVLWIHDRWDSIASGQVVVGIGRRVIGRWATMGIGQVVVVVVVVGRWEWVGTINATSIVVVGVGRWVKVVNIVEGLIVTIGGLVVSHGS